MYGDNVIESPVGRALLPGASWERRCSKTSLSMEVKYLQQNKLPCFDHDNYWSQERMEAHAVLSAEIRWGTGGQLTCHRKTKTAGRKMLRCRTAPHRALTCEYSRFFITLGGAKMSVASKPPARVESPHNSQDGRKQGWREARWWVMVLKLPFRTIRMNPCSCPKSPIKSAERYLIQLHQHLLQKGPAYACHF